MGNTCPKCLKKLFLKNKNSNTSQEVQVLVPPSNSQVTQPPETPQKQQASIQVPSAEGQPSETTSVSKPLTEEQQPEAPQSPPRPKKRAVLCGVAYKNSKFELKGTINDVNNMRDFLIDKFGFPEDNMRILTEEEANQDRAPTKKNILNALQWLVEGCRFGDSLVFYFAGHGLQLPDRDNEERDWMNEAICPTDFEKEGVILDNDINIKIVWPLKKGVTLHAIVDSCHSGTMLDLEYVYNRNTKQWDDNSPLSGVRKSTDGGLAISISACEDKEEAADTSLFTGKNMNGALTFILTKKVSESSALTYGKLLDSIHEAIEDFHKDGRQSTTNFLKRMFGAKKLSQKPQLSASERFGVDTRLFQL